MQHNGNKRRLFPLLSLIFCYIIFNATLSCVSQNNQNTSWVGQSSHDLVLANGPPNKISSDQNGGKILIYYIQGETAGYIIPSFGQGTVPYKKEGRAYWDYYFFYVNTAGVIYYKNSRREYSPPTEFLGNMN